MLVNNRDIYYGIHGLWCGIRITASGFARIESKREDNYYVSGDWMVQSSLSSISIRPRHLNRSVPEDSALVRPRFGNERVRGDFALRRARR